MIIYILKIFNHYLSAFFIKDFFITFLVETLRKILLY